MPKKARELSAVEVRRLKHPGYHAVGGVPGLHLQITPTGARSWILRAQVGNRRRDIGLGGYPEISIAQARERARTDRDQIRQGLDPVAERQATQARLKSQNAKAMTFDQATRIYLASKTREFKNDKHSAQWQSTLATYASPVIGKLPVDQIELAHIVAILNDIWTTKTETATRLRGRIENVLAWATVSGYRTGDNPARWKGNLDAILPKPGKLKNVQHHKALPVAAMPAFMTDLRRQAALAARALEFTVLTAARSGEARGATWSEIDLDAATWTVPAQRMKANKEHVVPLCDSAVQILRSAPRFPDCDLLFPSPRGTAMSDGTLNAVLKRMNVDATVHGFRSTFRDWSAEFTNYPHEVCEMALAHTIPNAVERAYRRGDLLAKRSRMMKDWEKFLTNPTASSDVIPLQGRVAS
ncbi:MAG: site-specific integrase [Thioalkalivibrio sp.]|nr:MAG: site-specific integrase [Thioalkalivibrio sp.]